MKPSKDNDHGRSNHHHHNHHNWLGFSLSPHIKMEAAAAAIPHSLAHHQYYNPQVSPVSSVPTPFCFSPPHQYTQYAPAFCYGVGENSAFHSSSLPTMPLKSDGSPCTMEALTRSPQQGILPNSSSPKLEDFLGGTATMAAHEREAMSLSQDSMYYPQNIEEESSRQSLLNHQDIEQVQNHSFYSGIYQTPLCEEEEEPEAEETGDGLTYFKNWVTCQYPDPQSLHQQMNHQRVVDTGGGFGSTRPNGAMGCGDLQALTLSMSPGSQSSCVTAAQRQISPMEISETGSVERKKKGQRPTVHRKSIQTFGQRTSQYRGVTRHRWTGRYEAHLWDNSCKKEGQSRKGRQVYLGGYDMEEKAARSYDLAALKYWGPSTHINFPLEDYQEQLEEMKNMTRQEYIAHLRRRSSGFSRGASMYRGVTRHHQHGRWQARIGRVAGNKDLYLGTFSTQEEAAEAYDIAAIKFRGATAVTNFEASRYDVERITASETLLAGDDAKKMKEAIQYDTYAHNNDGNGHSDWKIELYQPQDQNEKQLCVGNYGGNFSFTMALQNLIEMGSLNSNRPIVDEPGKFGGTHFSDPSSLVTSLSSSREASPVAAISMTTGLPAFASWSET